MSIDHEFVDALSTAKEIAAKKFQLFVLQPRESSQINSVVNLIDSDLLCELFMNYIYSFLRPWTKGSEERNEERSPFPDVCFMCL